MKNSKDVTSEKVFKTAQIFEKAAAILTREFQRELERTGVTNLPAAIIVNLAFSLELYLKCLKIIETGSQPKKIHNLHNLYQSLSPGSKTKIENYYEEFIQSNPLAIAVKSEFKDIKLDIDTALSEADKAFIEWRYIYEFRPKGFSTGVGDAVKAVRRYILELKPEWRC